MAGEAKHAARYIPRCNRTEMVGRRLRRARIEVLSQRKFAQHFRRISSLAALGTRWDACLRISLSALRLPIMLQDIAVDMFRYGNLWT
jgi:hypothetical protein